MSLLTDVCRGSHYPRLVLLFFVFLINSYLWSFILWNFNAQLNCALEVISNFNWYDEKVVESCKVIDLFSWRCSAWRVLSDARNAKMYFVYENRFSLCYNFQEVYIIIIIPLKLYRKSCPNQCNTFDETSMPWIQTS